MLRQVPGVSARFNCTDHGIEKDILIEKYEGKPIERPLALEVNGVFHYCRNSELPLGKDILKRKALLLHGVDVLVVPYFEWSILALEQRTLFLTHLLENHFN